MQDIFGLVCTRKRPQLLVEAASYGAGQYNRDIHLPRALKRHGQIGHGAAIMRLLDIETGLNTRRKAGLPSYSLARHIEVLAALIAETQLLRSARATSDQPKASGSESLMRVI